jgi:hypothetical protein
MSVQRNSRDPCLEILARRVLVSDSWWGGVSPAHEHRCAGVGKARHVSDLGDHDRGDRAAHAGDGLHGLVAAIAPKVLVDVTLECHDVAVVVADQLSQ